MASHPCVLKRLSPKRPLMLLLLQAGSEPDLLKYTIVQVYVGPIINAVKMLVLYDVTGHCRIVS